MKKLKAIIAAILLVATVESQPAFATNTPFKFSFDSINDVHGDNHYGDKDDNDSNWYISLDRSNEYTGTTNTMSSSNIFWVKIHRTNNDNVFKRAKG